MVKRSAAQPRAARLPRGLVALALGALIISGATACDEAGQPAVTPDAAPLDGAAADTVPPCPAGKSRCGSKCIDLTSDNKNCGKCGGACTTGQVCSQGKCTLWCQAGLTDCSGKCVDLQADNSHCGGCSKACTAGQVCTSGACALSCQKGLTECSGKCVDLSSDLLNCGK